MRIEDHGQSISIGVSGDKRSVIVYGRDELSGYIHKIEIAIPSLMPD